MPGYRTTTEVHASADVVWRVLADVESMPRWTASMRSVQVLDGGGPPGTGTRVRIEQPGLPVATWVVDEWRPPERFTWTSSSPGVRTHAEHDVVPAGAGACRVTLAVEHTGPLAGLVAALTMRRTRRYVDLELAGLKAQAEADAEAPRPDTPTL